MNEITRLLTDEQREYLEKLAMRYKMSMTEFLVTAAFVLFVGSYIDQEFDEYFKEDHRKYFVERMPPEDPFGW